MKKVVDDVAARFPDDLEVQYFACSHFQEASRDPDVIPCLERLRRRDPHYALISWAKATTEVAVGRYEDARASLKECLAISAGAASCINMRAVVASELGECDEMADAARTRSVIESGGARGHDLLARALASKGAPRESIEDTLGRKWAASRKEEVGPWTRAMDRARLALLYGDFTSAIRELRDLDVQITGVAEDGVHAAVVGALVGALVESGQNAAAIDEGRRFWAKRPAWTERFDYAHDVVRPHDAPLAIGALLVRAGRLPAAEFESERTKWYEGRKDSGAWGALTAAYAAPVETADEATAALPRLASPPPNAFIGGIEQIGKVYALAGRYAEAIPHLRRDARRCEASRYPVEQTRMIAWLGKALEEQNDTKGACEAYAEVLRRWGSAAPSSVTAAQARSRSQALRCP